MALQDMKDAYYDVTSFRSCIKKNFPNCNMLKLFHLNARSLRNKSDDVYLYLESLCCTFDILAFTETWYSGEKDIVHFDGYKCEAICRDSRRGGGVSLYFQSKMTCRVLSEFTCVNVDFESLVTMCGSVIIAVIYRPPSGVLNVFLQCLEELLEYVTSTNIQMALIGDLNIDLLGNESIKIDFFRNCSIK